jgi:DNA-binding NtrC family response regulator
MKILYVNPTGVSGSMMTALQQSGHEVTCVATPSEALDVIRTRHFIAVLIAEEIEDSETFEFISKVHCAYPELLVFQMSVWRSELPETLELLETIEQSSDTPQREG